MLWFLRKYQKGIYIVVTVFVIASFSFFGTYRTFSEAEVQIPDRVIGKAIDGNEVMEKELTSLMRFIESDALEQMISGRMGNLFNDGVIRKDVLKSGLGLQLMNGYFDELREDLDQRFIKFRKFKPYVHPYGVVSMEQSWKVFMPKFYNDYQAFKEVSTEINDKSLASLIDLYLDQVEMSPEFMRRFLLYQEKQYGSGIAHDQYLDNGDLSLFYAKSLQDWFGPRFVELATHFIYNSALYASENGYKVSLQEARASLLQTGMKNLSELDRNTRITPEELTRNFHRTLRSLGMQEKEAVLAWQKVLLFRRMYEDVAGSMQLDLATLNAGMDNSSEQSIVQVYELPREMRVHSDREALRVEKYLREVSKRDQVGGLPRSYRSMKDLSKSCPHLLGKRFLVEMANVTKKEVAESVSLKQTWNWELEEGNWATLAKKFPALEECTKSDRESRYVFLQELDAKEKARIDQFAREQIVDATPSMIKQKLGSKQGGVQTLYASQSLYTDIIEGFKNQKRVLTLLETAPIERAAKDPHEEGVLEELSCLSEDEQTFYSVKVLDRSEEWDVMSLKEALSSSTLDAMVDEELLHLYNTKSLSRKFEEIKMDLEEELFKKYFKQSSVTYETAFTPMMRSLKLQFAKDQTNAMMPQIEQKENYKLIILPKLDEQFKLCTKEMTISRGDSSYVDADKLFSLNEGETSEILASAEAGPLFLVVKAKKVDEEALQKSINEQRYLLGLDAKKALMKSFLSDMKLKVDFEWIDGS